MPRHAEIIHVCPASCLASFEALNIFLERKDFTSCLGNRLGMRFDDWVKRAAWWSVDRDFGEMPRICT